MNIEERSEIDDNWEVPVQSKGDTGMAEDETILEYVERLKSETYVQRLIAIDKLVAIGERVRPFLEEAARSDIPHQAAAAEKALERLAAVESTAHSKGRAPAQYDRRDEQEDGQFGAKAMVSYVEADNMGTRHDNFDQAIQWWMANMFKAISAFLVYTFPSASEALAGMLEVPCVHKATDTGNIISTEVLIYGYYQRDDGVWEAELVGKDLTKPIWTAAKKGFLRHSGKCKNEREPKL